MLLMAAPSRIFSIADGVEATRGSVPGCWLQDHSGNQKTVI